MELVSIVIPCYNNLDILKITLPEWNGLEWDNYEVVVADDGSPLDSGIKEYATSLGYRYYRQERRIWGMYRAYNMGIWHAEGDRIIFTCADIIPLSNLISGHMKHAKDNNILAGAVHRGPKAEFVMSKDPSHPNSYRSKYTDNIYYYHNDNRVIYNRSLDSGITEMITKWFWTGNASIPRQALIDINGFDEESESWPIRIHGELDIARRLQREGFSVQYTSDAASIHIDHDKSKTKSNWRLQDRGLAVRPTEFGEVIFNRDQEPTRNRNVPESWN